jgi:prepilin-type N-terminal cleavage/methylation domain-containing protein
MKGQTLIEVLVALGIISIIVTSVASIVTSSLGNTEYSKDQNTATKYAQEGLEVARSVRNNNYNTFAVLNGNYCLAKGDSTLGPAQGSCTVNIDNYFIRKIQIEQSPGCGSNVSKVTSIVAWQDGKCVGGTFCHASNLVTCFSRVNPVQIP